MPLKTVCAVSKYGNRYWYDDAENKHRLDGQAIEVSSGTKAWYVNDIKHRIDGPAIEYANGDKKWFIHGKEYTEKEYWDAIQNI